LAFEHCREALPLIASDRARRSALLELIGEIAAGGPFDLAGLRDEVAARGLDYYDRYLRSVLFCLVAVDALRGPEADEADIQTILKGPVELNPDHRPEDWSDLFERGLLYLLGDEDGTVPEAVAANGDWILALAGNAKARRATLDGHLAWLRQ
jgi:hypothetical protein